MNEKRFFRACPECKKFFTSRECFVSHKCMIQQEKDQKINSYIREISEQTSTEDVEKPNIPVSIERRNEQFQRNELKKKYISFLKDKGIDMSTERSFRKLEEAYRSNGGE